MTVEEKVSWDEDFVRDVLFSEEGEESPVSSVFSSLRVAPKKVLVTGGAGFIGSHTADFLLSRGDEVVIIDNLNDYYAPELKKRNLVNLLTKYGRDRCRIYVGDLCDKELVQYIFKNERPDYICHLAARAGVRASIEDPFNYLSSNVEGTMILLEESRKHGIKNFVYASSSSVYGNSTATLLKETDVTDKPISPYAATKKAIEVLAYTYAHLYGLKCSGLRFFTVYGPRGRPDMAAFKFINRIYREMPIDRYGDGSTMRDYTYIDDIVSGIVGAIDNPRDYEVYNLGNGKPALLSKMIAIIEKAVGKRALINTLPAQAGDVDMTNADISKAAKLIGYAPKTSLEEGLFKTVQWFKDEYLSLKEFSEIDSEELFAQMYSIKKE